jgi:calcineurin-like phosphoesterase family protein
MNSALIKNRSEAVADDDIVIFSGDFVFALTAVAQETTARCAAALKGHKIIVRCSHDFKKIRYVDAGFDAEFYQEWDFGRFLFCHRPDNLPQWHKDYDFVFYGHVHDKTPEVTFINTINVCLDANNLKPIDITNYFTEGELKELQNLIKIN